MRKALKRSLSLLLAITIIFGSMYVGLGEVDFSGLFAVKVGAAKVDICGENLSWNLDEYGILTISGTGDMTDFTGIGLTSSGYESCSAPWSSQRNNIRGIIIEDGVTTIGNYAFFRCRSITFVSIPDSVLKIGDSAFYNCDNLVSITIPDSITKIGGSAFYDCDGLTGIEFPNSVTSIGYNAFKNCNITSVKFGNKVKSIGEGAFGFCEQLDSVYITDIGAWCSINFGNDISNPMFYADKLYLNDELVADIIIPEGVEKIPLYAFDGCESLTSVRIPSTVISSGQDAFNDCSNLTAVYCSDVLSWLKIQFYNEYSNPVFYSHNLYLNGSLITNLVVPEEITTISSYAFYNCKNLKTVNMHNNVTSIGGSAFRNCSNIENVYLSETLTSIGSGCFSGCNLLKYIVIPENVESIGMYAFYNCTSLSEVTISGSVTIIKQNAFKKCESLHSVYGGTLEQWCNIEFETENSNPLNNGGDLYLNGEIVDYLYVYSDVTNIKAYAFYNCKSIKSVCVSNELNSIGNYAFYSCENIRGLEIEGVVENIGESAFADCSALTSVTVSGIVSNLAKEAFKGCTSLSGVYLDDVSSWCATVFTDEYSNPLTYAKNLYINNELVTELCIPSDVTSIGKYVFYNCKSLNSVTIPDNLTNIGVYAFWGASSIVEVHIFDLVKWCEITFDNVSANPAIYSKKLYLDGELITILVIPNRVTEIKDYTFYKCSSVESIVLPDTITTIGSSSFSGCTKISSIVIPDSVTTIGSNAFAYCTELEEVIFGKGLKKVVSFTFLNGAPFLDCTKLKSVYITDLACWSEISFGTASSPLSIADLYYNGELQENIEIPYGAEKIGSGVYCGYDKLKSVVIPEGVTSIGKYAFEDCVNLTVAVIPESVTSIEEYAFENCGKLTIYGFPGSYAETYAEKNSIPFKDISEFGAVDVYGNSDKGVTFRIFDKIDFVSGDAFSIASGNVNLGVKGAILTNNGDTYNCSDGEKENEKFLAYEELSGRAIISKHGFYDYIIPNIVIENFKRTKSGPLNVYMTTDKYDWKPYISTVFGRQCGGDGDNVFKELQSNSLNILTDTQYDIVITADLLGEEAATYYLSQDTTHRVSNSTGVFLNTDLYDAFELDKPIYAYAVTASGKVTEPVAVSMKKIFCSKALSTILSSDKINLLGSTNAKLSINDSKPILGGTEVSMSFVEIPIGAEIEGDRIRISLGRDFFKYASENGKTKEKEWINYRKCCEEIEKELGAKGDNEKKLEEFRKIKEKWGFSQRVIPSYKESISFNAEYFGYIEGYINNGNVVFTEFSGSAAAQFAARVNVKKLARYYSIHGGIKTSLVLKLARSIPDENIPLDFDATLNITPELQVRGGIGWEDIASAELIGTIALPTNYEFSEKHLTMSLEGKIGAEAVFLIFEVKNEDLVSGKINLIDVYFPKSTSTLGGFSEAVYSDMAEIMYEQSYDATDVESTLVSRDYASSTSEWLAPTEKMFWESSADSGSAEACNVNVTELQTSVYANSQTKLVKFGDKIMMVYVEDCAERDTYNRYRLMYTVYNPSTNVWSEPKAVCDSGKMDVSPSLTTDGKNVYIAWQTVNATVTGSSEEDMYNAMNNMEIYSAKYDETSDSFVNVTQHTSNSTYDYSPSVTVKEGSATVYWVNAESNNYAPGEMSIHSSANSEDIVVYDDMNYILSLNASGKDISYVLDCDGNLNTTDDIKLFTNGEQVGEDAVAERTPVMNFTYGDFNGEETLFYTDGGVVYYVKDGATVEAFSDGNGISGYLQVTTLNGNPAVIYNQYSDTGSELCISTFDNDKWSEPVFLTGMDCSLSNVDVVSVDGKIYSVFNRTQVEKVTDEETGRTNYKIGQTDLCMLTSEGYYDLNISHIGYNEENITVGSSSLFTVVMENKGTERIRNVEFVVSDSLGKSQTITKDVNLAPGSVESVELEYTAQEDYTKSDLTVTATIVDCEDVNTTDNIATTQIGRTDIEVGEASVERLGDVFKITCDVSNHSLIDAENVNANISFDIYRRKVSIGTIAANSSYTVELLVAKDELVFDENDICTLTFTVSTTTEELVKGNNENTVTVGNTDKLIEHEHNFVNNVCDGCGMNIYSYEISDDGVTITGYSGDDTELVLPATIGDRPVTAIGDVAYFGNEKLTSITIPDSVKDIGYGAFSNCTNLTTITVEENNTKYASEDGVLFNKDKTTLIQYPAGKTDVRYTIPDSIMAIYDMAFMGCSKLGELVISDTLESIGEEAITQCSSFKYVFYKGSESDWSNVSIGIDNGSLTTTKIHYNSIDHTYEYKVDKEPTCIEQGSKHKECIICGHSLAAESIPLADHTYSTEWTIDVAPTCTKEGSKSHHCTICSDKTDITAVEPNGHSYSDEWTIDLVPTCTKEGSKSHHCTDCSDKKDVTVISVVDHEIINDICKYCGLSNVWDYELKNGSVTITQYNGNNIEVVIPYTICGVPVTGIGDNAFYNCTNITSITIPGGVTTIGNYAFYNCSGLKTITISDKVTTIGNYAFASCTGLNSIVIPDSVTNVGVGAFYECGFLKSVVMSKNVTEINESTFYNCYYLASFTIPEGVTNIGNTAFYGCMRLVSVDIPDSVTSIGNGAFSGCKKITSLDIGDNITSIGNSAFYGCTSLTSINIPDSITTINPYTFYNCKNISYVLISDRVEGIGKNAFYGFTGTIYCVENSVAHEHASTNDIAYVLINNLINASDTTSTQIDYNSFVIRTSVQGCNDISEIIGKSQSAIIVATPSYEYNELKIYGTGTTIAVFDGDNFIGEFTMVVDGDINGDSVVDVLDSSQMALASSGKKTLEGAYALAGDSNSDDIIDISDYQDVVNKAVS